MKAYFIVACVLIAVGAMGLVFGQFSYTKDSETAQIGPIELTVTDKETVNIPVWAGVGSIALGAGLMAAALIKR